MKNLTDVVIMSVAYDLITKNGKTTTLEVKKALRADGYFATQDEVSVTMSNLYAVHDLEFINNGRYREYYLSSNPPASAPSTSSYPNVKAVKTVTSKDVTEVTMPNVGDWEVVNPVITFGPKKYYAAAGSTRSAVRYAYTQSVGGLYIDTRARKVK